MKIKYLMITLLLSTFFETPASADVLTTLSPERNSLGLREEGSVESIKFSKECTTDSYATDDEEGESDDLSPSAFEALERFETRYFSKASRYNRNKLSSKEKLEIEIPKVRSKKAEALAKTPNFSKR